MLIINCTKEEQSFKALGNHFSFKPGQVRAMTDSIGRFISLERRHLGMAELPEQFEDPDFKSTPEGKALMAQIIEDGVRGYIEHHRQIVSNNQVSLRRDLEQANIKADPAIYATAGEIESMKIVAKYARADADLEQAKVDEVRELVKELKSK